MRPLSRRAHSPATARTAASSAAAASAPFLKLIVLAMLLLGAEVEGGGCAVKRPLRRPGPHARGHSGKYAVIKVHDGMWMASHAVAARGARRTTVTYLLGASRGMMVTCNSYKSEDCSTIGLHACALGAPAEARVGSLRFRHCARVSGPHPPTPAARPCGGCGQTCRGARCRRHAFTVVWTQSWSLRGCYKTMARVRCAGPRPNGRCAGGLPASGGNARGSSVAAPRHTHPKAGAAAAIIGMGLQRACGCSTW